VCGKPGRHRRPGAGRRIASSERLSGPSEPTAGPLRAFSGRFFRTTGISFRYRSANAVFASGRARGFSDAVLGISETYGDDGGAAEHLARALLRASPRQ
jgi:hypothetical protein